MKRYTNKELILNYIEDNSNPQVNNPNLPIGCETNDIAEKLNIKRANVSKILNELYSEGKVLKIKGKPVLYKINPNTTKHKPSFIINIDNIIGGNKSLKNCVQQAKAAMLYPPHGLNTLLLGETGVGKTMFAELMHRFAIESSIYAPEAPFISFNCADYANNPQLLLARLFGCKKGAYTGADKDQIGFVERANKGILFLDEVHRLPPEGQEMLFYLMDKGEFTPLGESEIVKKSEVLVICATTENANATLLQTFRRRMPMNITLPSLRDRTYTERLDLICEFLRIESTRIGKEIIVSPNSLRCLLLYNCDANIGQLKSDIQLGCANAFLKCISKGEKFIKLTNTDFAPHVKQGLILYKNHMDEIDKIVQLDKQISFKSNGSEEVLEVIKGDLPDNFYETIAGKIEDYKKKGIDEDDINIVLSNEINSYFKRLVSNFDKDINKEEIAKLVSPNIVELVEVFIKSAVTNLGRVFPSKTFYGLCLHIDSTIKRINSGKDIINPTLQSIMQEHREEYALSLTFASKIEREFAIKLPLDEVGFIALFLTLGKNPSLDEISHPIVVVAMHGQSTATSMVDVAKKLINAHNIYSYNMSLETSATTAYQELKDLIIENHRGAGVLLLVDMGSLKMFASLIEEETRIPIKVIEMSSTLTVLECARKSIIDKDMENIWYSVQESHINYLDANINTLKDNFKVKEENIIVTTCSTGEGSAVILKEMLLKKIDTKKHKIQIIPLNIDNVQQFYSTVNSLGNKQNIIAIVGTFNPEIFGVPFISISEVFKDTNLTGLKNIINDKCIDAFTTMINAQKEKINHLLDENIYESFILDLFELISDTLKVDINENTAIGLILHLTCALERLHVSADSSLSCGVKELILDSFKTEYEILENFFNSYEKQLKIKFTVDEICFVLRTIKEL
ncbi:sigma 54-interacting transcriptional regulator [uncultured Clostridium sp.]|uniref:sigma 54-interacting transcriptional regulator n=1 Tax=uncultured Clostridium sp. TaxID=59620 RepID=UPI0026121D60|nr:sigma-54-dependent transcriptional regulator [uncultured Clostridium sp.]